MKCSAYIVILENKIKHELKLIVRLKYCEITIHHPILIFRDEKGLNMLYLQIIRLKSI